MTYVILLVLLWQSFVNNILPGWQGKLCSNYDLIQKRIFEVSTRGSEVNFGVEQLSTTIVGTSSVIKATILQ